MRQGYLAFASTTVRRMVAPKIREAYHAASPQKRREIPKPFGSFRERNSPPDTLMSESKRKLSDRHYDKVTGGASELTATIVDRDIAEIRNAVQRVRRFVNTVVWRTATEYPICDA